jgi:hypothetical protein
VAIDSKTPVPRWKAFEELAASIQRQFVDERATVTTNEHLTGRRTGIKRQIDICIRQNVGTYDLLIVIDCKDHAAPVDVKEVEEFMGLVGDVGANKAAMISASGFTSTAKTRAADAGIDLLRLIDAGDHPWRSYVSIPAVLTDHFIASVSFEFWGTGQMAIPFVTDWRLLPLFRSDGSPIDLLGNLLIDRWSDGSIPQEDGVHKRIPLSPEQTYTKVEGKLYSVNVGATVVVETRCFFGQLPLSKVAGFHDEIRDEFKTRGFTTESVSFADLERDWRPISSTEALAVEKVMDLVVSSVPERIEVQE